ncbi:hypothetical protein BYT27DRAFT_7122835, partial [Phlegmacium glaucopus]
WMERADSVGRRLNRITANAPVIYADQISAQFLVDNDKDLIHNHVVNLSKLQKLIYKYQNEIYALGGICEEYHLADIIVKDVCKVVRWIEELLCYAMVDSDEFRIFYETRKFMYQILN